MVHVERANEEIENVIRGRIITVEVKWYLRMVAIVLSLLTYDSET